MKHLKVLTMVMACASALVVPGRAVALSDAAGIISRIDSRMAQLDKLIFDQQAAATTPNALAWRAENSVDTAYQSAVNAVTGARIKALKAQTGVQITGQAYYRLDGALGMDEDDAGVSLYRGKVQVEARWYFLQSGLLKRKGRIEELNLKGQLEQLQHRDGALDREMYARRERLRLVSDSVLASILLHRLDNLKLLEEAYDYLLDNKSISGDDLLRILDDRAEAEQRLATIAMACERATGLASVVVGTVTIDTTAVLAALTATNRDLQILDLKGKLIDRQAKNMTWWSDVRLAPFVRYSHYFREHMPASKNVDVGMTFTIPINAETSRSRKALTAEKQLLECERQGIIDRSVEKVRKLAADADRLNRAIAGECARATSLRNYLQSRRNAYSHRTGEYNRITALKEYNSYIRSLENIVEMQYRRDCIIADLQDLVPDVPVLDHCAFTLINL